MTRTLKSRLSFDACFSLISRFPAPARHILRGAFWYSALVPYVLLLRLRYRRVFASADSGVPLFSLPDGSSLSYSLPWHFIASGPFALPGRPTEEAYRADVPEARTWKTGSKLTALLLDLWTSGGSLFVVQADFDTPERAERIMPVLDERFGSNIIMTRSKRGGLHAFFLVETQSRAFGPADARAFLRSVLPEELFREADLNEWAMSRSFLNPDSIELLSRRLRGLHVFPLQVYSR